MTQKDVEMSNHRRHHFHATDRTQSGLVHLGNTSEPLDKDSLSKLTTCAKSKEGAASFRTPSDTFNKNNSILNQSNMTSQGSSLATTGDLLKSADKSMSFRFKRSSIFTNPNLSRSMQSQQDITVPLKNAKETPVSLLAEELASVDTDPTPKKRVISELASLIKRWEGLYTQVSCSN
jgi:hypothetical protein